MWNVNIVDFFKEAGWNYFMRKHFAVKAIYNE